jgi:recombination protein RecA
MTPTLIEPKNVEREAADLIEALSRSRQEKISHNKKAKTDPLFDSLPMDSKPVRDPAKSKALDAAIGQITKSFGDGSIMRLGEAKRINVETIPTGSISLDLALGGGLPKGRVIEIYGPESSGKTTLALHAVSEFQRRGGQAAFVDAEHALDPEYAAKIGVDVENLLISQPDTGEQALEIVETLVRSGAVDVIVIDSVAALTPRAEIEGEMGGSLPGLQARLMSQALRKLTAIVAKSHCTLIFLNQMRMKIGVMFGNPETTSGGNALKFYASVRLDIRRTGKIESGVGDMKQAIGNTTRVKVVKNKIAPPFRQAEFEIRFGVGIDKASDLIITGSKLGVIEKSGAFYDIEGTKYQGLEKARAAMLADKNLMATVDKKVRTAAKGIDPQTGEMK